MYLVLMWETSTVIYKEKMVKNLLILMEVVF